MGSVLSATAGQKRILGAEIFYRREARVNEEKTGSDPIDFQQKKKEK